MGDAVGGFKRRFLCNNLYLDVRSMSFRLRLKGSRPLCFTRWLFSQIFI
jgi:hypothetical protein